MLHNHLMKIEMATKDLCTFFPGNPLSGSWVVICR